MKSGKSTVSFTYLGKSYRFFEEIRRVKIGCAAPNFASLKYASCLSETAQTWREKRANSSDMVCFSGKSFRHDNKTRLLRCVGAGLLFKSRLPLRRVYRKLRLCAEVSLTNVIVVESSWPVPCLATLPSLKNVCTVSNLKCHISVLRQPAKWWIPASPSWRMIWRFPQSE